MFRKCFQKMNWDDTGYLISKNRYSENSIIAEIFRKAWESFWDYFWLNFKKNKKLSTNW